MKTPTILVVEDEGIIAADIRNTLQALGYTVPDAATTGEQAVAMAAELRPDLVLMDIMLPGDIDGVAAAGHIRAEYQIPIVFLTAHTDEATVQRAKFAEPYGYIAKPLGEGELRIGIEMALHKHQAERRAAEREDWLTNALTSIGEAVIATDSQGQIRFINSLAESITGWSRHGAAGQHLDSVFVLTGPAAAEGGPVSQALQRGFAVDWSNTTTLQSRHGLSTPVEYTATRIHRENGEVVGVVIVFRDIGLRKGLEEERERLVLQLQDALSHVKTLHGMTEQLIGKIGNWIATDRKLDFQREGFKSTRPARGSGTSA